VTPLLSAEALRYTFPGDVTALDGLSLAVAAGQSLAILGPNGAGKSTLLLHLNGTLRPQSGLVRLDGTPSGYSRKDLTAWRRRVGLVLQDADDQLFAATVFEDVSFGPLNLGLTEAEARQRVEEALAALSIADLRDRPTHMLSGGQKRRVAIAGAVAMRPEVLLLDEPTAGLDEAGAARLVALLRGLLGRGMTLVFSTHDVDLAWQLADRVALFRGGRVVAEGAAEAVLGNRAALAEVALQPPVLLDLCLRAQALGLLPAATPAPKTRADFAGLMAGWAPR
jgi:cobalt/nickel transport system ATP-binding protein